MPHRKRTLMLVTIAVATTVGCHSQRTARMWYAESHGRAGQNIAGTKLLADTFRQHGAEVTSSRLFGQLVAQANVVVWCPSSGRLPQSATCQLFEEWFTRSPGRTIVWVGRDYDSTLAYWRRCYDEAAADPSAPAEEQLKIRRYLARAQSAHAKNNGAPTGVGMPRPSQEVCDWFELQLNRQPRDAMSLKGPWSPLLQGVKYPPRVTNRLTPVDFAPEHETQLLADDEDVLIFELTKRHWNGGRLILVANASMFLNLPLVQKQNQDLADQLVRGCPNSGRVVFLHTSRDPHFVKGAETHFLLRLLVTDPFRWIFMHLSVLGLVLCMTMFPRLGRPNARGDAHESDFGRHVLALGRILASVADKEHAFALRRKYFRQQNGGEEECSPGESPDGSPFRDKSHQSHGTGIG